MADNTQVLNDLVAVMQNGTEEEARKYILDHFSELPEEMQEELVMEMATSSLETEAEELQSVVDYNKKGLQALAAWQIKKGEAGAPQV